MGFFSLFHVAGLIFVMNLMPNKLSTYLLRESVYQHSLATSGSLLGEESYLMSEKLIVSC